MNYIHLEEVRSTNSWLLEQLALGADYKDETVVWTKRQTAGRGQVGNSWEAEADKNISFSVLLQPRFLAPREQFVLSEMTALSVADVIAGSVIKWPNDIFVNEKKICGMLIENQLQGSTFAYSILGIGINVNQESWMGNAPNPTSIKLESGVECQPEEILHKVIDKLHHRYMMLQADPHGTAALIHRQFCERLYRRDGWYPYVDASTGMPFEARICEVEPTGLIHLETKQGEIRVYGFKEVKFVLPCGVTKE